MNTKVHVVAFRTDGVCGHDWNVDEAIAQQYYEKAQADDAYIRGLGGEHKFDKFEVEVPWEIVLPLTDETREAVTEYVSEWLVDNTEDY